MRRLILTLASLFTAKPVPIPVGTTLITDPAIIAVTVIAPAGADVAVTVQNGQISLTATATGATYYPRKRLARN